MQFTTHGPFAGSGWPGCQLGSNPPMLIRVFGLAHGPLVQLYGAPLVYSLPMMNRRFRPATSASRRVLLVPSLISRIVRLSCTRWPVGVSGPSVPSTPIQLESPAFQYWLYRAGVANGCGRVSSVVA